MNGESQTKSRWAWRIMRWAFVLLLMTGSFIAGAAVSAFVAVGLLAPVASVGFSLGMAGLASAGMASVLHALYAGDSATRLTTLEQLEQTFLSNPNQPVDPALAEMLLPALRQCEGDSDWKVALLASQLIECIEFAPQP
ncbi:MAG: hypothetical protein U0939_25635 [Pirellulales bacterium]